MKNYTETKKEKSAAKTVFVYGALALILGFAAGNVSSDYSDNICSNRYSFVNRRFACFTEHTINKKDYQELKGTLTDYIQKEKEAGHTDLVSVYFRDLESGPTMGINERVDFVPASLLKLPNALVLVRLDEEGEVDLEKEKLPYVEEGRPSLAVSMTSLSDLIVKSLMYSDNEANSLLVNYIKTIDNGRNLFSEIDRDLGIISTTDTTRPIVNTKGYGSIFRMLYNSSFLTPENSEKLLSIMSQSVDGGGLAAGVPEGMGVAHKFGQRNLEEDDKQLHDCGIVYYPDNPYLLCIMTRGRDFSQLGKIITEISRLVYQEFDSRRLGE